MKLLRLKITDPTGFRSLAAGFEVHFLREWDRADADKLNPYILAGPNGSGKSNLLEALAAIFYHLECQHLEYRPESFEYDEDSNSQGFQAEKATPDGFEIEYLIPCPVELNPNNHQALAHILIQKEPQVLPQAIWINRADFDPNANPELSGQELKLCLPEFVLGYSSGENEILSLPFFKMRFLHFDEYWAHLIGEKHYGYTPEGRLIYLDKDFSQAILLSLFLAHDSETDPEGFLLKPFQEEVGLTDIKRFRLVVRKAVPLTLQQVGKVPQNLFLTLDKEQEGFEDKWGQSNFWIDLTQKLQSHSYEDVFLAPLSKLKKCSTCFFEDEQFYYFDYWVNEATKQAFRLHFGSPLGLFQTFQILLTLNLFTVSDLQKKELYQSQDLYANENIPALPSHEKILRFEDVMIQKTGITQPVPLKALSDGEHQFLHALGLCVLFKDTNSLFLLDEPETHFNPDWRANFISRLRDCFQTNRNEIAQAKPTEARREILITTHSPFLISDSLPEYVLVFDKGESLDVSRPDYQTLGASISQITFKTFGKRETIGGYAEQILNAFVDRFTKGEDPKKIMDETYEALGDSIEKTLFVQQLLNALRQE